MSLNAFMLKSVFPPPPPFLFFSSEKDMDENESNQSLMTSSQYPKEAVRKRQNSARSSVGSDSSRFSRKSFKLDYRLEEDVTKSKKGKDGRFVNPWPTWKNLSIPNVLRWLIMEKDHSSVPCSKEVAFGFSGGLHILGGSYYHLILL